MNELEDVVEEFLVECHENLDQLDGDLAALAQDPASQATLGSIFRTIHTIKGNSGFLGFAKLESVAHKAENLLCQLRDGEIRLQPERAAALVALVDSIHEMLAHIEFAGGQSEATQRRGPNRTTGESHAPLVDSRLHPIASLWTIFPRIVRELAAQCGKQVRIEIQGGEPQLDPTTLQAVKASLTHLVRNAVDHGIESPQARIAAGKPPEGHIQLRAFRQGQKVAIEIIDDGRGLDVTTIRRKAVEQGLIIQQQADRMSDGDVAQLIFTPGFSTATAVTHISGRGVGLDVVKTNIEKLGGTVVVHSRPGRGTTIALAIPSTAAAQQKGCELFHC